MSTVDDLLGPSKSSDKRIAELERQLLSMTVTLHRYANVGSRRKIYNLHVVLIRDLAQHESDCGYPDHEYAAAHGYDSGGQMKAETDHCVFGTSYEPATFREMQKYLQSNEFLEKWRQMTYVFNTLSNSIDFFFDYKLLRWEGADVNMKWEHNEFTVKVSLCMQEQELRTETCWFNVPTIV